MPPSPASAGGVSSCGNLFTPNPPISSMLLAPMPSSAQGLLPNAVRRPRQSYGRRRLFRSHLSVCPRRPSEAQMSASSPISRSARDMGSPELRSGVGWLPTRTFRGLSPLPRAPRAGGSRKSWLTKLQRLELGRRPASEPAIRARAPEKEHDLHCWRGAAPLQGVPQHGEQLGTVRLAARGCA